MSFAGEYSDPNHPGCKRTIQVDGTIDATISGTDTPNGKVWTVSGTVKGDTIVVDFSPKGGPKGLVGKKRPEGIQWEDGNIWHSIDENEEKYDARPYYRDPRIYALATGVIVIGSVCMR